MMLNANRLNLNPKRIYFYDLKGLEEHQNKLLKLLRKSNPSVAVAMRSSGTTSGMANSYLYTKVNHEIIEDYHISRIMHFNQLNFGNVFRLKLVGLDSIRKPCEAVPFSDPYVFLPLGLKNKVRDLYYRIDYTIDDWNSTLEAASGMKPSFVYGRPSEVLLMRGAKKIGFPVITSMETLHGHTRKLALEIFSDCIDKMRCWDGGLSFFECRHKTKHINDELCLAEENQDGKIYSTDFFNHDQKFVKYHNGDLGQISIGLCECGIYGKYFKHFNGKSLETIITKRGPVPGSQIVDAIFQANEHEKELFNFSVIQESDGKIIFVSDKEIDSRQKEPIAKIFSNIGLCTSFRSETKISKNKQMLIVSKAAKEYYC